MEINALSQVYGVMGDPIDHSLSPLFQARFIEQAGINAIYVPFHVTGNNIQAAIEGLWALNVQGINITVPHKELSLSCIETDADAACIGAVNTICRGEIGWQGANTDWLGLRDLLYAVAREQTFDRVILFGAGGTARAVVHMCANIGVQHLFICNRGKDRLKKLMDHAEANYPQLTVEAVDWEQAAVTKISGGCALAINSAAIGLADKGQSFPLTLSGRGIAIDVVYSPNGKTPFTMMALGCGWRALDGLPMLVSQGAYAFQLWHGIMPDKLDTLRWLEAALAREAIEISGWER